MHSLDKNQSLIQLNFRKVLHLKILIYLCLLRIFWVFLNVLESQYKQQFPQTYFSECIPIIKLHVTI